MEDTLTLARRRRQPERTLESANPCESIIEIVRRTQRNVKPWSTGEIAVCWTAVGMLEAERHFRKIVGYRDLATIVVAIHNRRERRIERSPSSKETAIVVTAQSAHHETAAETYGARDILSTRAEAR